MNIDQYQKAVTKVKKYSSNPSLYLIGKLTEESGEVAKEIIRREDGREEKKDLKSELGDLLWCIAAIADNNDITLSEIIDDNLEKLKERNLL